MENTIEINGVKYVKEDSVNIETYNHTGDSNLMKGLIGKKVIVRSRNEGVNAGIVVDADATGIILSSCRRLWYHAPNNPKMSWYEGVALSGICSNSKVSETVNKTIVESYSVTLCSDDAFDSIMEKVPHDRS